MIYTPQTVYTEREALFYMTEMSLLSLKTLAQRHKPAASDIKRFTDTAQVGIDMLVKHASPEELERVRDTYTGKILHLFKGSVKAWVEAF